MKKLQFLRSLKKGISLVMAAALAVGMCACGGKDKDKTDKNADNMASKQNVFRVKELTLDDTFGEYGVSDTAFFDDRLYYLIESYKYGSDEEDNTPFKLISIKTDGTDAQKIKIELPDAPGYTGSYGDGDMSIYGDDDMTDGDPAEGDAAGDDTVGDAGAGTAVLESKLIAPRDGDWDGDIDIPYTPSDYESVYYNYFHFTSDAKLIAMETKSMGVTTDEGYEEKNENFLCLWDLQGKLVQKISMKDQMGTNSWINNIYGLGNGQIMITYYDDENECYVRLMVSTADGKITKKEGKNSESEWWQDFSDILTKPDGSGAYVIYYGGEQENYAMMVAEYDAQSDSLKQGVAFPQVLRNSGFNDAVVAKDGSMIFSGQSSLYKYRLGDADAAEFMNCVNSDIASYGISQLVVIDDDHFVGTYYEYSADKNVTGFFTRIAPEDVPDKKTLVLGMNWMNMNIVSRVVAFNKKSEEYRIAVTDYSQYNSEGDYNAGLTKLNNDIISGHMPDILLVNPDMPMASYISKGLLADIGKLIAEDEELSKTEFLQNVFDAYKVNDKLYYVIPGFTVNTLIAKKDKVGDRTSWTMDEFLNIVKNLPEGASAFSQDYTRDQFLNNMMTYCGSDFVDVSTGKCAFNTDNFIKMLEYAKTIRENLPEDFYDDGTYWQTAESQYRDGRTLLMYCGISNMDSINYQINGYFGGNVSFVGFPTDSGQGSVINYANQMYAISAKSKNLDGAWQFVRYYLTDEYQESQEQWSIPVSKKAFDNWAAKGTQKPFWTDENGEKHEYDNTFWINGESVVLPVFTQAEVDKIKEFVTSIRRTVYYNEQVVNIVTEEAAAFFAGQKSAKDVADIIQSRVSIYVNE